MSFSLLAETHPVARKEHSCIWCDEAIPRGQQYIRMSYVFDGDVLRDARHRECEAANLIQNRGLSEWEIWPGQNDRPPQGIRWYFPHSKARNSWFGEPRAALQAPVSQEPTP